jgi:hypothetical protein
MSRLLMLPLLALLLVGFAWQDQDVSLSDAASDATATPTVPKSRLTVRFVQNGEPVVVSLLEYPTEVTADGVPMRLHPHGVHGL